MKKYEVKVTRQALEQMNETVSYISSVLMAPDTANRWLDHLKAEIVKLADFPEKYALIDEAPWKTMGIRKLTVKNFLVYYWIDDENSKVQVIAAIYSKRDQVKQLSEMNLEQFPSRR